MLGWRPLNERPFRRVWPVVQINSVVIEDTFAEAFPMTATRLIVTAASREWALTAAREIRQLTGAEDIPPELLESIKKVAPTWSASFSKAK